MDAWLLAGSAGGRRGTGQAPELAEQHRRPVQAGAEPPVPREGKEPPAQQVCSVGSCSSPQHSPGSSRPALRHALPPLQPPPASPGAGSTSPGVWRGFS